jgi:NAD+-dependent protein deacetylase SIR2
VLTSDLVLIIGTSLVVHPFAELPNYTPPSVPRIIFNYEALDDFERPNDVYIPGDCDASIWSLCEKLGWTEALQKLHKEVGGVDHKFGAEKEGEGLDTQDVVDKLAKELEEELRLDKEEDGEIGRVKSEEGPVLKDAWDDDTVVVTKKDAEPSKDAEVSKDVEVSKDAESAKEDASGDAKGAKSKDEGKPEDGADPKL